MMSVKTTRRILIQGPTGVRGDEPIRIFITLAGLEAAA